MALLAFVLLLYIVFFLFLVRVRGSSWVCVPYQYGSFFIYIYHEGFFFVLFYSVVSAMGFGSWGLTWRIVMMLWSQWFL